MLTANERRRIDRALAAGWTFAGGKGGGGVSVQTAELPLELRPLISGSVAGTTALQPLARQFFEAFGAGAVNNPRAQDLQIAPLTGVETGLVDLAGRALGGLNVSPNAPLEAANALNLQGPLNRLAGTAVATPEAEDVFRTVGTRGFLTLDRPVTTPSAENQALDQVFNLAGGPVGTSPVTREAIEALERQFATRSLPALQNQLAQAGLGRSGALEQGITDLRGQLLAAEVPLLQEEIASRRNVLPVLESLSRAQTGRETGAVERELGFITSLFNPLTTVSAQQQGRSQLPIERQLATAFQAAPAFTGLGESQLKLAEEIGKVGALPRLQAQAKNEAELASSQRLQSLAEAFLLGPLGVLPSLIGSRTITEGGGK